MKTLMSYAAAAAAIGGVAAPAAAQYAPYPQTYPHQAYPQQTYPQQPYPQQAYPGYGQQGYGYNQGYPQNSVGQIIDQMLGNRYNVTDRQAISQCASAALAQAAAQYGNGYNRGYGQGYNGYNGYNSGGAMRVTAITDVQRRSNGLRVSGMMSSGGGYNNQYGYQNRGYGRSDVSFRCNVDYRGAVTNVRIRPNNGYGG
jgi:hypothetical protein